MYVYAFLMNFKMISPKSIKLSVKNDYFFCKTEMEF